MGCRSSRQPSLLFGPSSPENITRRTPHHGWHIFNSLPRHLPMVDDLARLQDFSKQISPPTCVRSRRTSKRPRTAPPQPFHFGALEIVGREEGREERAASRGVRGPRTAVQGGGAGQGEAGGRGGEERRGGYGGLHVSASFASWSSGRRRLRPRHRWSGAKAVSTGGKVLVAPTDAL